MEIIDAARISAIARTVRRRGDRGHAGPGCRRVDLRRDRGGLVSPFDPAVSRPRYNTGAAYRLYLRLGALHIMVPLDYNLAGKPEIFVVSNAEQDGKPLGLRGAGMGFHSDGEDKVIPN